MVRATVAEVKKLYGGTCPPNWADAAVTALCTSIDYHLDGKTAPDTLSTTDVNVIQLANELVYRWMNNADWATSGGASDGRNEPVIWTRDLLDRLQRLSSTSTFKGFTTGTQQAEDT